MTDPLCVKCGDIFNPKRLSLGYLTCLECGSKDAQKEKARKAKCTAPAYNKGAYQYVGSRDTARFIGR